VFVSHVRAALRVARHVLVAASIAAVIEILVVAPVAAHGELVFQLGAERVVPGGVVEVRGDLATGDTVEIALISKADGTRRSIATLADFEEGHFQGYVTIPTDVIAGDYLVEAGTDSISARAPLTVAGSAALAGGERSDQGEPLVAPVPSTSSVYSFASPGPGVRSGPAVEGSGRDTLPVPPILIGVAAVVGAVVLVAGMRLASRTRSSA
jgi:hypothetical protein